MLSSEACEQQLECKDPVSSFEDSALAFESSRFSRISVHLQEE